jgi:hypothetical protein
MQTISFKQFVETKQRSSDLGEYLQDERLRGIGGLVYGDCLYIEDVHTWTRPHGVKSRWYTPTYPHKEYASDNLEMLERILYEFAVVEGYFLAPTPVATPIRRGDVVRIKPEFRDDGDERIVWKAIEDEDGGRIKISPQLGLPLNPVQVVRVEWLEKGSAE